MINKDRDYIEKTYPEISCGVHLAISDGWVPLVNKLTDEIVRILGEYTEEYCSGNDKLTFEIFQIKEKFAGLRYYISRIEFPESFSGNASVIDERIRGLVHDYETTSFHLCETCGAYGEVRYGSWRYTSCDEHVRPEEDDEE